MEQLKTLEKNFELGNKLESDRKIELARALGLQPRQIAIWFQNRRARSKTKQLERDYDALKRRFESLKDDNQILQTQNQKLQAQVKRKTLFFNFDIPLKLNLFIYFLQSTLFFVISVSNFINMESFLRSFLNGLS